mmetsp:Transcript_34541/g.35126  ORF Transcript_34541/g.35126 Transcript_34541/m.35126 type:complete len:84 (+) Transcript_34541:246-497(+)
MNTVSRVSSTQTNNDRTTVFATTHCELHRDISPFQIGGGFYRDMTQVQRSASIHSWSPVEVMMSSAITFLFKCHTLRYHTRPE